jgi:hypothetical protein
MQPDGACLEGLIVRMESLDRRGMSTREETPRLLGAAFLGVVLTSLTSGVLIMSATGSGSVSQILAHVADNATLARLSVLAGMANSVGILVLAAFLYLVLAGQSKVLALFALACWLGEAMFYALGQVGVSGLIPLSQDFVKAGAPDPSYFQVMGEFLYHGVYKLGGTILMFFYCAGGLAWYFLFYRSRLIPRAIPAFGLVVVAVGFAGTVLGLLGNEVPLFAYLPILPFELAIGTWLLLRGTNDGWATPRTPTANE